MILPTTPASCARLLVFSRRDDDLADDAGLVRAPARLLRA
jgi:hypothetical protein